MGCADECAGACSPKASPSRAGSTTRFTLTTSLLTAAIVRHELGDADDAGAAGEELLAVCERHGIVQWVGIGRTGLGAALFARGKTDTGIAMVDAGVESHLAKGPVGFALPVLALAAKTHLQAGNPERALALLEQGLELADRTRVGWQRPEVERLRAATLLAMNRIGAQDAARDLRAAADRANAQGAAALEARALTSVLRLSPDDDAAPVVRLRLKTLCDALDGQGSADIDEARSALDLARFSNPRTAEIP